MHTYQFWAPWIGKNTRQSNLVLNTEFEKVNSPKAKLEDAELAVTEDHLIEELFKQRVCELLNISTEHTLF